MRFKDLTLMEKVFRTVVLNIKRMKGDGTLKDFLINIPLEVFIFQTDPPRDLLR